MICNSRSSFPPPTGGVFYKSITVITKINQGECKPCWQRIQSTCHILKTIFRILIQWFQKSHSFYLWTFACISKIKLTHLKWMPAFLPTNMHTRLWLPVETHLVKKIRPICSCCSHQLILPARMVFHVGADIVNKPCTKASRNNIQMTS